MRRCEVSYVGVVKKSPDCGKAPDTAGIRLPRRADAAAGSAVRTRHDVVSDRCCQSQAHTRPSAERDASRLAPKKTYGGGRAASIYFHRTQRPSIHTPSMVESILKETDYMSTTQW